MGLFGRRLGRRHRPALRHGERVVAWAPTADRAAVVVATTRGLWLPSAGGARAASRLGWHEIHKAIWDGAALVVTAAQVVEQRDGYLVVADQPAQRVGLSDPHTLPDQVRSRVTRSVAYSVQHEVPGGAVRVVGRRAAGEDGVHWTVRYEDGADPSDPVLIELTDELVAAAEAHPG